MNLAKEKPGLSCYTDGASRGNPGPSAYAYLVCDRDIILDEQGKFLGRATNNEAEYQAVIAALDAAAGFSHGPVTVFSDSELVIRQLSGRYKVRAAHLLPLYKKVKVSEEAFEMVSYRSVPRENALIQRMDSLCNRILDDEAGPGKSPVV